MSEIQINAVILAGGSGIRLWPMSRQNLPKQFLALDCDATPLQTTIDRLSPTIEAKDVLIVTQEALSDRVYVIDGQGAKFNPKNVETIQ